jgi:hypothetical protein
MAETALATSLEYTAGLDEKLPLVLALTPAMHLIDSLDHLAEDIYMVRETKYNPATQLREDSAGLPVIINRSTKCQGICGTNIGGIIISDRDQVSDD